MSFDLHLEHFESGDSAPADRVRVLDFLRQYREGSADHFGNCLLHLPEDAIVEFSAKGLDSGDSFSGCGLRLRELSPAVLDFVFDLAVLGDMVIFNAQGGDTPESPLAILINDSQRAHLPEGTIRHPALCTSPMHLGLLLGFDFEKWATLLDAAMGGTTLSKRELCRLAASKISFTPTLPDARPMTMTIPGTAEHMPKGDSHYRYVSDDGSRDFARQFDRLSANAAPRHAKHGGMGTQGCRLWLPDGSLFHPIGYRGDYDGWRADIETAAQRLGLFVARIEGDRIIVDDGRSFSLSECRLERDQLKKDRSRRG